MRDIVIETDSNPNFSWDHFMKSIDMSKVVRMISAAWASIEATLIRKSWKQLGLNNESENTPEDNSEPDIQAVLHILAPDADFGVQIDEWLHGDADDLGYDHLDDEQILALVESPEQHEEFLMMILLKFQLKLIRKQYHMLMDCGLCPWHWIG